MIHDDVSPIPPLLPSSETSHWNTRPFERLPKNDETTEMRNCDGISVPLQFCPALETIWTHSKCSTESVNICSNHKDAQSLLIHHAHVADEAPTSLLRSTSHTGWNQYDLPTDRSPFYLSKICSQSLGQWCAIENWLSITSLTVWTYVSGVLNSWPKTSHAAHKCS